MSDTRSTTASARSGRVRIDDRPKHLATRLETGDIAVINVADLDKDSAAALVAAGPVAVLNAQPSLTGRTAALGPRLILDAGILLVDDLGQDIMSLREGQEVTVTGGKVLLESTVIATGKRVEDEHLEIEVADSAALFAGFEGAIEDYLAKDGATVLRGEGVPQLHELGSRPILLVTDASDAAGELRAVAGRSGTLRRGGGRGSGRRPQSTPDARCCDRGRRTHERESNPQGPLLHRARRR